MAGRGLTPKGGSDRKKLVLLLHLRMAFQPQQPPAAVEPRRVSLSCREHERLGGLHMCGTCAGYVCCQPDPRFLESSNARHLVAAACMRTGSECCGLQRWKEARVEPRVAAISQLGATAEARGAPARLHRQCHQHGARGCNPTRCRRRQQRQTTIATGAARQHSG